MKETFYFSHDYNARSDEKIKRLLRKHSMQGYGIYWAIIEDLYNNENNLKLDFDDISYDLRCDVDIVKSIILDFDLFTIDGDKFGSISVERRLNERNLKSKKASESANERWKKSNAKTLLEDKYNSSQVYILRMYNDDESFIKIGVTNGTIASRYGKSTGYKYEVLFQLFSKNAVNLEKEIHDKLSKFKYSPLLKFDGYLECYQIESLLEIQSLIRDNKTINQCERIENKCERMENNIKRNAIKESKVKENKVKESKEYDFVSDDFNQIIIDWLDYKKARKESYKSEKSIQAFYNKLQKLSGGSQARAVEIIEQSMANNWAGIFELKNKQISTKLDPNGDFKH